MMDVAKPAAAMPLRWSSGFWTVLLALVHVAMTPVFYPDSLRSIAEGGVLGSVDSDPTLATLRAAAFFYLTSGILLGLVGWMVMGAERRGQGAPGAYAIVLAVTGLWGVALSPLSGFWFFFALAWLAKRNAAPARARHRVTSAKPGPGWGRPGSASRQTTGTHGEADGS